MESSQGVISISKVQIQLTNRLVTSEPRPPAALFTPVRSTASASASASAGCWL